MTDSRNIVVLGSGVGAAILAQKKGFGVFVSDSGSIPEQYKNELIKNKIEFEEEKHSSEKILNIADIVIKSPGIPDTITLVQQLKNKGIVVIDELEFASRYTNAKIIAITGSNGKTTTTRLLFHILNVAGLNVGLAGNIGFSFAKQRQRLFCARGK